MAPSASGQATLTFDFDQNQLRDWLVSQCPDVDYRIIDSITAQTESKQWDDQFLDRERKRHGIFIEPWYRDMSQIKDLLMDHGILPEPEEVEDYPPSPQPPQPPRQPRQERAPRRAQPLRSEPQHPDIVATASATYGHDFPRSFVDPASAQYGQPMAPATPYNTISPYQNFPSNIPPVVAPPTFHQPALPHASTYIQPAEVQGPHYGFEDAAAPLATRYAAVAPDVTRYPQAPAPAVGAEALRPAAALPTPRSRVPCPFAAQARCGERFGAVDEAIAHAEARHRSVWEAAKRAMRARKRAEAAARGGWGGDRGGHGAEEGEPEMFALDE